MAKKKKRPIQVAVKSKKQSNSQLPLIFALLATAIVFIPSLMNDFVTWDDDVNILKNPNYKYLIGTVSKVFLRKL